MCTRVTFSERVDYLAMSFVWVVKSVATSENSKLVHGRFVKILII